MIFKASTLLTQTIIATKVTYATHGLTTWIELSSKEGRKSNTSLIQGDTAEVLQWAENLVAEIKGREVRKKYEEMDQEELDEQVHDAKSQEASDINNGGRYAQIEYLIRGI